MENKIGISTGHFQWLVIKSPSVPLLKKGEAATSEQKRRSSTLFVEGVRRLVPLKAGLCILWQKKDGAKRLPQIFNFQ
jgi:hypothetical protein